MFGKWEVRELVYQINFPPFSARFDKRTKERKLIFGIFVHTELSISSPLAIKGPITWSIFNPGVELSPVNRVAITWTISTPGF